MALIQITPAGGLGTLEKRRDRAKPLPYCPWDLWLQDQAEPGFGEHLLQKKAVVFLNDIIAGGPTRVFVGVLVEVRDDALGPVLPQPVSNGLGAAPDQFEAVVTEVTGCHVVPDSGIGEAFHLGEVLGKTEDDVGANGDLGRGVGFVGPLVDGGDSSRGLKGIGDGAMGCVILEPGREYLDVVRDG